MKIENLRKEITQAEAEHKKAVMHDNHSVIEIIENKLNRLYRKLEFAIQL